MLDYIADKKLCEFTQADLGQLAGNMWPGCSPATLKRHVYSPFIAAWNVAGRNVPPLCDYKKWQSLQLQKKRGDCPDDGYIETLKELIDLKSRAGKRNNVVVGALPLSYAPESR